MSTAASITEFDPVQENVGEHPSPWSSGTAIVLYIAVAKLIVQLLTASRYGFFSDELYYLGCSERLNWGYIDFPPFTALIAFVARHTLGESLLALRFIPALAGALLVWVTGAITREIGGGRFAQALGAIAVLVTPAYLIQHHRLGTWAFEPVLWAGIAYFAVRSIKRGAPNNWIWAGALAGIGLENRYSTGLFLFGLVVGLVFTSARKCLSNWQLWAGGCLALVLFAPNLIWEIVHHFPFLAWQKYIRSHPDSGMFDFSVSNFLLDQVMMTLPVIFLWIVGIWFFLISAKGRQFRFLGFATLVVFGVFAASGKTYYTIPIFAIAYTGGAVAVESFTERSDYHWLRSIFVLIIVAAGLILAPTAIPILPVERLILYQRSLHLPRVQGEPYLNESEIPQFAWEFGWDEMAAAVGRVYNALPEEEKSKAGIFAASYGEAGAIDLLGKKYGLPKAICPQLAYYDFGTRNYTGDVMIFIGNPDALARECRSVQFGASLENPYGFSGQRGPIINVCRGFGLGYDLRQIWPYMKRYY